MEARKQAILAALDKFVRQRAGLEFGNYGDWKAYRAEQRSITKDLHHYRELERYVTWRDSITADMLLEAARSAYSGRLTIDEPLCAKLPNFAIDYCTGQYFPTEYRRAACAVLASAIWARMREDAPINAGPIEKHSNLQNIGDWLRANARREFGRGIAARWFN